MLGINGRFYGARVTGVQRFAREITRRMSDSVLLLPGNGGSDVPEMTAVQGRLHGHAWEQLELPSMSRAHCDRVLHLAGTAPIRRNGDVIVIHDVLPFTHPQWFSPAFRTLRRAVLTRIARTYGIITVSHWAKQEIVRVLGVNPDVVTVVTQGLAPFDRPADAEAVVNARKRYSLPEEYVLFVGAPDPRKNLEFLLRALANMKRKLPVVVVGAPRSAAFARHSSHSTLGHISDEDLHAIYTAATVLCFPSVAEGFGRPPLEAMACGTPAVVADTDVAREVMNGTGYLAPLQTEAWIDALDCAMGERVADDVRNRIVTRYNWDSAAQQVRAACV